MSDHPPSLAYNLDRDVEVLAAMASNLTPYLYEDEMFGYLAGDLPKLTLGGLLLRVYRLSRLEDSLDAEQQSLVQDARINLDAARSEWAVHYESKLVRELTYRIDAFNRFLRDCSEDSKNCVLDYPVQAEKRTMSKHLADELTRHGELPPNLLTELASLDSHLQRIFQSGAFITDERLAAIYSREDFWWLYGGIRGTER